MRAWKSTLLENTEDEILLILLFKCAWENGEREGESGCVHTRCLIGKILLLMEKPHELLACLWLRQILFMLNQHGDCK